MTTETAAEVAYYHDPRKFRRSLDYTCSSFINRDVDIFIHYKQEIQLSLTNRAEVRIPYSPYVLRTYACTCEMSIRPWLFTYDTAQ